MRISRDTRLLTILIGAFTDIRSRAKKTSMRYPTAISAGDVPHRCPEPMSEASKTATRGAA
jgi:hypothetical protein